MIKTHLTPKEQNISITLPQDYVGKEIEVLVYAVDELKEKDTVVLPKQKLSELAGALSKETTQEMLNHLENGRNDWDERLKKQF
jgi:FtsZ-binding cell division protein ZapB